LSQCDREDSGDETAPQPSNLDRSTVAGGAMPLISCPACGRQISAEAAACPQCGHPNRPAPPTAAASATQCRSCGQPAVAACRTCGGFYCAQHGGIASSGLGAPLCSVCYDANRVQVGCRAVILA